jgi:dihydrofolate reductase
MSISLITAFDPNQVIGHKNQLPWHLPEDLQHFKEITSGHTIVMGRKTFESIGKPLPNRHNIIISSSLSSNDINGATVIKNPQEVLNLQDSSIYIIGGASIYEYFLPYAQRLYITHIKQAFQGDCFFPTIDWEQWALSEETPRKTHNSINYTFATYQRHPANTHL